MSEFVELDQSAYWRDVPLPGAWPDHLGWRNLNHLGRVFAGLVSRKHRRVELPPAIEERMAGFPKYLFQEFHHLPNGNYSRHIARGYVRSFDSVMLGEIAKARQSLAAASKEAHRVLDIGVGGGHMAKALLDAGVPEVWGIEPSPYLLQLAVNNLPSLKARHAVIEKSGFAEGFFDAAFACFVFHEVPPRHADTALAELQRIIKKGGTLSWIEPSPTQLMQNYRQLYKEFGWRGAYFRLMARRVYEPFVMAWHQRDKNAWLAAHGFQLIELRDQMPWQWVRARRL